MPALEPAVRDAVRDRILKACAAARDQGITIVSGEWSVDPGGDAWVPTNNCACPLGALLVVTNPPPRGYGNDAEVAERAAADELGVSTVFVNGFVNGVDGYDDSGGNDDPDEYRDGFAMGVEVRMLVGPIKKDAEVEDDEDDDS